MMLVNSVCDPKAQLVAVSQPLSSGRHAEHKTAAMSSMERGERCCEAEDEVAADGCEVQPAVD
jgi:hypothetical protein